MKGKWNIILNITHYSLKVLMGYHQVLLLYVYQIDTTYKTLGNRTVGREINIIMKQSIKYQKYIKNRDIFAMNILIIDLDVLFQLANVQDG